MAIRRAAKQKKFTALPLDRRNKIVGGPWYPSGGVLDFVAPSGSSFATNVGIKKQRGMISKPMTCAWDWGPDDIRSTSQRAQIHRATFQNGARGSERCSSQTTIGGS